MKKTFVLDTNVLLHEPNAIYAFGDNNVILTEAVLEELDNFKKGRKEINANARSVARTLDKLRELGKLTEGVIMENGGVLRVERNHRDIELPPSWEQEKADNRILQVCKALNNEGETVILITKDIMERIKADTIDILSEDFESDNAPNLSEQYKGRRDIYISKDNLNKFFKEGKLDLKSLYIVDNQGTQIKPITFIPNEFLVIRSCSNPDQHVGLGRIDSDVKNIVKLYHSDEHPYGVTPRNVVQKFMQESLMLSVETAPLVIIKGPAGTAKTFYSLATGLEKVVNNVDTKSFRRILVCRPNVSMDEELGFLPGTEKEKIAPLMRPIMDNLETLVDSNADERYKNEKELNDKIQELFERGSIDTQAVGFLRGRSIVKHWLIIDEAQNLTPRQAKAIITRAGEGTKVIMVGDPEQIDNPFLDSRSNGLSYAAETMKGSPLCFQITAKHEECVRSKLAMEGSKRMK